LHVIARNLCCTELRRRGRNSSFDWDSRDGRTFLSQGASQAGITEAIAQKEFFEAIDNALAGLPGRERTAILLLENEDMSYQEIASSLNVSVPPTKALIHRGRQKLKRRLAGQALNL
jgi:RNA polymerase sigma-70 factor (ECF subfamily)